MFDDLSKYVQWYAGLQAPERDAWDESLADLDGQAVIDRVAMLKVPGNQRMIDAGKKMLVDACREQLAKASPGD